MSTVITGDSRVKIYKYNNINLAIEVNEQCLTQYLTFKNIAYTPYFYTNSISIVKLYKVKVIIN